MDTPDESITLISAGKVQGTPVVDPSGNSLGEIYDVMLEKRTGRVAYAIMSFGGVLGIGKKYHPLPWLALKYVPEAGGYVVGIPKDALMDGPTIENSGAPWETGLQQKIEGYYGSWLSTA
ncbi:PRC-barrel domain-containing protein [Hyphomicrobium sp.]|uniref:PRC-barrel domain-containing protein n=1 Tax=Hyphomicrobium sp. TaxID=82 RepID=UPI000FBCCEF6|nr:PRC-barrel domain-containing protein [Hyphomicrobium sp.]RUO97559.1 MAG: PRC-barrel domain containing protein [Hyphomicrobium sp.]